MKQNYPVTTTLLFKSSTFKTKISIFLFLSFISITFSQSVIPNMGFEDWTNIGNQQEEPLSWNSSRTGLGIGPALPQASFRESVNPHSGNYCARITALNSFGSPLIGYLSTGRVSFPTTNPVHDFVETVTTDSDLNAPFTDRPQEFAGYFRFTSVAGSHATIKLILHDNFNYTEPDQGGSATHLIGEAQFLTPASTVSDWTPFSVPITYHNANTPSHILIIVTSGDQIGTTLWIDDFEVRDSTLGIPETEINTIENIKIYPNPTQNYIKISGLKEETEYSMFTILGTEIQKGSISNKQKLDVNNLKSGIYFINFKNGPTIKFVKN